MIGRRDDALFFHLLNQARGAIITDGQPPLHIAGRGAAIAGHNRHRLVIETITTGAFHIRRFLRLLRHLLNIVRHALFFQKRHDFFNFFIRHKRPVHALHTATAAHIKHIALTQ